jgi:NAD+ synthase
MFKEDVVNMANFVGLPPEIIKKVPSAELYPEQTDEADLGGTYTEIDPILKRLDQGMEALIERGMSAMLVHNIFGRIEKNRHKSQLPPIIKITSKQQ